MDHVNAKNCSGMKCLLFLDIQTVKQKRSRTADTANAIFRFVMMSAHGGTFRVELSRFRLRA